MYKIAKQNQYTAFLQKLQGVWGAYLHFLQLIAKKPRFISETRRWYYPKSCLARSALALASLQ